MIRRLSPLQAVKTFHTIVWAFFASCIVAIPILALARRLDYAVVLLGVVAIEILVLLVNGWRCPLTAVAARYTTDRRDNFDIYLPQWLARYNKLIFGSLLAGGVLLMVVQWLS
jgi:polyferredoxin